MRLADLERVNGDLEGPGNIHGCSHQERILCPSTPLHSVPYALFSGVFWAGEVHLTRKERRVPCQASIYEVFL